MHRSDQWWHGFGSVWRLGCVTDRWLCRELHVDRESFRLQRDKRGWVKENETTLDEYRKAIVEQEDREWRNSWMDGHISERMRLRFDERRAEFEARINYLQTLNPGVK